VPTGDIFSNRLEAEKGRSAWENVGYKHLTGVKRLLLKKPWKKAGKGLRGREETYRESPCQGAKPHSILDCRAKLRWGKKFGGKDTGKAHMLAAPPPRKTTPIPSKYAYRCVASRLNGAGRGEKKEKAGGADAHGPSQRKGLRGLKSASFRVPAGGIWLPTTPAKKKGRKEEGARRNDSRRL